MIPGLQAGKNIQIEAEEALYWEYTKIINSAKFNACSFTSSIEFAEIVRRLGVNFSIQRGYSRFRKGGG